MYKIQKVNKTGDYKQANTWAVIGLEGKVLVSNNSKNQLSNSNDWLKAGEGYK